MKMVFGNCNNLHKNIYMKCIIAGSRTINDYDIVVKAIKESGFAISEIVSGEAAGPDTIGITYGNKEGN
jgi:hypothetical protein